MLSSDFLNFSVVESIEKTFFPLNFLTPKSILLTDFDFYLLAESILFILKWLIGRILFKTGFLD